jgi:hypothetical protein
MVSVDRFRVDIKIRRGNDIALVRATIILDEYVDSEALSDIQLVDYS